MFEQYEMTEDVMKALLGGTSPDDIPLPDDEIPPA